MSRSRQKHKGRREVRTSFAGIPREVMLSDSYREIGANAVRVLNWLAFQYKGSNNGYLSATRNEAKDWGIAGASTLARAIADLTKHRLIVLTRQGRFMNPGGSPNLYAVTWEPVDERAGNPLDIAPGRDPLRKEWKRTTKQMPKNTSPAPILESVAPVTGLGGVEFRPINGVIAPDLGSMGRCHPVPKQNTLLNTMEEAVVSALIAHSDISNRA